MSARISAVDWTAVQADFPVNRQLIWLNSCGICPPPAPVIQTVKAHLDAYAERCVAGVRDEHEVHMSIAARVARLLNVDPEEIGLIHHTNEGMTFLSHGFALNAGDRVLLMGDEYPSNVYPWEHWRARGVRVDAVPIGATPDEFLDNFRRALGPDVRVASVSAVHWCTGMPLPLAALGALCAERGIEFVVDGSQGVGLVPLDLRALQVGYLACSAWKWLLGPLGLGLLFVRRDRLDRLRFPFKGTGSVVNDGVYLPYRDTLKPTAERYVLSTPNFNDWIYLDASLAYLERLGFAEVQARLAALGAHLRDRLRAHGFQPATPEPHGTAIVATSRPGWDADRAVSKLREAGVVAASRLGRVRMAPHIHIGEQQLDRVAGLLASERVS